MESDNIRLKVEIRRNSDGEQAVDVWPDWDFNVFWWEEGNASCDCNRELFFERALGRNPCWDEATCGDGGYSVRLSNADTGAILYDEFASPTPEAAQK